MPLRRFTDLHIKYPLLLSDFIHVSIKRQISVNISNNKFHENSLVVYNITDIERAMSISVVWRLFLKAHPNIKDLQFTAKLFCGEREINYISLPWVYRNLFSYICRNSGNLTLILRRSRTGTVWFYTSTSNKRAARPKLYTKVINKGLNAYV